MKSGLGARYIRVARDTSPAAGRFPPRMRPRAHLPVEQRREPPARTVWIASPISALPESASQISRRGCLSSADLDDLPPCHRRCRRNGGADVSVPDRIEREATLPVLPGGAWQALTAPDDLARCIEPEWRANSNRAKRCARFRGTAQPPSSRDRRVTAAVRMPVVIRQQAASPGTARRSAAHTRRPRPRRDSEGPAPGHGRTRFRFAPQGDERVGAP